MAKKTDTPLNFNFDTGVPETSDSDIKKMSTVDKEFSRPSPELVNQTPFDRDERFSLIKAESSFVEIKNTLLSMHKNAQTIDVKDPISNNTAMEMLVQCKALVKMADKIKNNIPAYNAAAEFKSGVDTFVREQLRKPIEKIESLINPKVSSYQRAQAELQRRIAQKQAEEEAKRIAEEVKKAEAEAKRIYEQKLKDAEELQKRLNKEADKAGVERVHVETPEFIEPEVSIAPSLVTPIVKQTEKVTTDQGKATVTSKWVCVVIDSDKVPREYCMPDQKALDNAVESGIREISGCKIEEKFEAKVRMSSKRSGNPFGSDNNESF